MRSDRIINIWPEIKEPLKKIAKKLVKYSFIEETDLLHDAVLALRKLNSTKRQPATPRKIFLYCLRAMRHSMRKIWRISEHEVYLEEYRKWR